MPDPVDQRSIRNRLLRSLASDDFAILAPLLTKVDLHFGDIVEEAGETNEAALFIESGIASMIVVGPNGQETEGGHVGREGMTGRAVVLGAPNLLGRTIVQVAGTALRISAEDLTRAMKQSEGLRALMLLYVAASETQVAHTLLAAAVFTVRQRLARWLLMYHDRVDGDDLPMTHDFLSQMLGVRRSSVTNEIHYLEEKRVVKAARGHVLVLDRAHLLAMAGGSYGIPEREYQRLIPADRLGPRSLVTRADARNADADIVH